MEKHPGMILGEQCDIEGAAAICGMAMADLVAQDRLSCPRDPWTIMMLPRRKPPRRIASSPGTPVDTRSSIGLRLSFRFVLLEGIVFAAWPKRPYYREDRTEPGVAGNGNLTVHWANEPLRDPHANSETAVGACSALTEEALKDPRLVTLRYSDAVIANRQPSRRGYSGGWHSAAALPHGLHQTSAQASSRICQSPTVCDPRSGTGES